MLKPIRNIVHFNWLCVEAYAINDGRTIEEANAEGDYNVKITGRDVVRTSLRFDALRPDSEYYYSQNNSKSKLFPIFAIR